MLRNRKRGLCSLFDTPVGGGESSLNRSAQPLPRLARTDPNRSCPTFGKPRASHLVATSPRAYVLIAESVDTYTALRCAKRSAYRIPHPRNQFRASPSPSTIPIDWYHACKSRSCRSRRRRRTRTIGYRLTPCFRFFPFAFNFTVTRRHVHHSRPVGTRRSSVVYIVPGTPSTMSNIVSGRRLFPRRHPDVYPKTLLVP